MRGCDLIETRDLLDPRHDSVRLVDALGREHNRERQNIVHWLAEWRKQLARCFVCTGTWDLKLFEFEYAVRAQQLVTLQFHILSVGFSSPTLDHFFIYLFIHSFFYFNILRHNHVFVHFDLFEICEFIGDAGKIIIMK